MRTRQREDAAHGEEGEPKAAAPSRLRRPRSECLRPPASDGQLSYDLVALVLSSNKAALQPGRRRQAVRQSWADEDARLGSPDDGAPSCSLRVIFVLGGSEAPTLRGDELSLPVEDGYRQLSQKVLGAMAWLLDSVAFKFVLKTDDDSFVCLARLLALLHAFGGGGGRGLYLGAISKKHKVITNPRHEHFERWGDVEYVELFNRTVYATYMQGAGYVLSADLVDVATRRAAAIPRLPAIEDALVGTLVEGSNASVTNKPTAFRYKNRDEYAVTVCEKDTEFALVHKLSTDELRRCRRATQRRRSKRCPNGPCVCRTLGQELHVPRFVVGTFAKAEQMQARRRGEEEEEEE